MANAAERLRRIKAYRATGMSTFEAVKRVNLDDLHIRIGLLKADDWSELRDILHAMVE